MRGGGSSIKSRHECGRESVLIEYKKNEWGEGSSLKKWTFTKIIKCITYTRVSEMSKSSQGALILGKFPSGSGDTFFGRGQDGVVPMQVGGSR